MILSLSAWHCRGGGPDGQREATKCVFREGGRHLVLRREMCSREAHDYNFGSTSSRPTTLKTRCACLEPHISRLARTRDETDVLFHCV